MQPKALNSIEQRAAIETGQEVDRQDIALHGKYNERVDLMAKAFSIEELELMKAKMIAAEQGASIAALPEPVRVVSGEVVDGKDSTPNTRTSGGGGGGVTPPQDDTAARGWRKP